MNSVIESPCVEVCQLRKGENVCKGCFRTLEEIARWTGMTSKQRRQIMKELPMRKTAAESAL